MTAYQDYQTVAAFASDSFVERKSEFIGHISPVSTEEAAVAFLEKIRAEHRKATHNVYAYLLREGNIIRHSDDGEPQGTAGMPVLEVLRREGLTDVVCVVTRYFGGILLGGGGLVRAYSHGAKIAVDAAKRKIMRVCRRMDIQSDYDWYGKINSALQGEILPEGSLKLLDTIFTDKTTISLLVKEEFWEILEQKLINLCNGRVTVQRSERRFEDFA